MHGNQLAQPATQQMCGAFSGLRFGGAALPLLGQHPPANLDQGQQIFYQDGQISHRAGHSPLVKFPVRGHPPQLFGAGGRKLHPLQFQRFDDVLAELNLLAH